MPIQPKTLSREGAVHIRHFLRYVRVLTRCSLVSLSLSLSFSLSVCLSFSRMNDYVDADSVIRPSPPCLFLSILVSPELFCPAAWSRLLGAGCLVRC